MKGLDTQEEEINVMELKNSGWKTVVEYRLRYESVPVADMHFLAFCGRQESYHQISNTTVL